MNTTIRPKDRDSILQALRAGVVPRTGQHLIQVGRGRELESLLNDVNRIADGGSAFRIVVGEYGSGKTFFLNLVRAIGMEKKLVVASADLNPDRRLQANGGQARSLYSELMRNLSTRTKPEGGAMNGIVEKFIATAKTEANGTGQSTESVLREKLLQLTELVNGYDFADVIAAYCRGFEEGNEQLRADAVRWLRGEFSTKTDAKRSLGVRAIVDDSTVYDQLKLMARFVRLAGFGGLLVNLDEMVNIYKIANTQSRNSNYEQLLRILNDSLQGTAEGLGFIFGGTPEFLTDKRRGLYSYEALQSRLSENKMASNKLVDLTGPVLRLSSLSQEDFFILLKKLLNIYASGDPEKHLLPDNALEKFMEHCHKRIGESYFRSPRGTITQFINLLAILDQNPETTWQEQIGTIQVTADEGDDGKQVKQEDDNEFASFNL
jgi:hypothetical protein